LIDIAINGGTADPIRVTHWSRDLAHGVTISDHPQACSSYTYLGHSEGIKVAKTEAGVVECFVPFGYPHGGTMDYAFYQHGKDDYRISGGRKEDLPVMWGCDLMDLYKFIDKYYEHADEEYTVNTPEYREIVRILKKE
jgi:hypothetical protein